MNPLNIIINKDHDNPRGHIIGKAAVEKFIKDGKSVLEIGGQHWQMRKYFPSVKLVDIDKKWKPDILGDITTAKIKSNSFDVIYSSHVLEHIYEPEKMLKNCHRILRKNGILFFIVPVCHPDRLWSDGDEWNTHQHYFTKQNIINLLTNSGFELVNFNFHLWVKPYFLEKFFGNVSKKGDIIFIAKKK